MLAVLPGAAFAQDAAPQPAAPEAAPVAAADSCRIICGIEWKFEPTLTAESVTRPHRVVTPDGRVEQAPREHVVETVFALDLKSRYPWLGWTAEAISTPFRHENAVELELDTNFYVLTSGMTRGWAESHVDVVDQYSPSARPGSTHAYGHKLDFEWDTSVFPFKRLPEGRWLRGLELETSLDYLATGIPKKGDVFGPDPVSWTSFL